MLQPVFEQSIMPFRWQGGRRSQNVEYHQNYDSTSYSDLSADHTIDYEERRLRNLRDLAERDRYRAPEDRVLLGDYQGYQTDYQGYYSIRCFN
jgi:hypothetical protein